MYFFNVEEQEKILSLKIQSGSFRWTVVDSGKSSLSVRPTFQRLLLCHPANSPAAITGGWTEN